MACLKSCISGSVYSCDASETRSTAWADASADSVVSACAESIPPTPGESMSRRPPEDLAGQWDLGGRMPCSLFALPSSETYWASESMGMASR